MADAALAPTHVGLCRALYRRRLPGDEPSPSPLAMLLHRVQHRQARPRVQATARCLPQSGFWEEPLPCLAEGLAIAGRRAACLCAWQSTISCLCAWQSWHTHPPPGTLTRHLAHPPTTWLMEAGALAAAAATAAGAGHAWRGGRQPRR